jgi:hypothetical protein
LEPVEWQIAAQSGVARDPAATDGDNDRGPEEHRETPPE